MGEQYSAHELLLSNEGLGAASVQKRSVLVTSLKWVLKIAMWAAFIAWLAVVFLYPLESTTAWITTVADAGAETFLGFTGTVFLVFSGPVLLIALLSVPYLVLSSEEDEHPPERRPKRPSYKLWTFPVLVSGPFGVVSAAELIGILAFAVYIIWVAAVYAVQKLSVIIENADYSTQEKWAWFLRMSGRGFGLSAAFCLSFMFVPVARGSVLLRLINIPSEHAIRYHAWLGHLVMTLLTLHGTFYFVGWILAGEIPSELISWTSVDGANLAGIINIFFGWTIWLTSLPFVRPKNFELFYYTHHLYVIFIIFFAMHVGNFFFNIVAGTVFLFMVDRFLRFCQSRKTVDVISMKNLPCGAVELVLSKPASLGYNALSFIFLRVKEVSFLQWHPFSVTSSPLNGKCNLSVLIKALGDWTSNLKDHVLENPMAKRPEEEHSLLQTKLTASVEGPYGHQSPYYLTYENLVLIAGGIGITPFVAVLSDILQRIKQGKPCLPRNIFLVWAVKQSDELSLLSTINSESISQFPSNELHLRLLIYVTRESEPPLENGVSYKAVSHSVCRVSGISAISVLASTGNKMWYGGYVFSSIAGLIITMCLLNVLYITPFGITNWWYQGLLIIGCMVASVLLFGGATVAMWHKWEHSSSSSGHIDVEQTNGSMAGTNLVLENLASSKNVQYGSRPDFKEIFGSISKLLSHADVGVIVCGPLSLQSSVARECRSQNTRRLSEDPIFHFNSHSFSL